MVRVRSVERRERGWYDVILLPTYDCKWTFKEGDVAVLSCPRPGGLARPKRSEDDVESEVSGRVAGTVRRHIPIDTRDPLGAIFHFYGVVVGTNLLMLDMWERECSVLLYVEMFLHLLHLILFLLASELSPLPAVVF